MMLALWIAVLQDGTAGSLAPAEGGAPLSITAQEVRVRVANGIAVTTVTQTFHNSTPRPLEAVYSFPVPKDASLSSFSMWINGKEVIGEVLEKKKAREIYDSITQTRRDPGLLEQNSHKLFQARVFPVPAQGDQRVQVAYYQPVEYDGGFCTYTYPLRSRTKEFSEVDGTLSIDVQVDSEVPVVAVRSPSHADRVAVRRDDEHHVHASYEHRRGPLTKDFVLIYQLAKERTGVRVVPFNDGKEDGYFMLTLTPADALDRLDKPSHYVLVVDISGSMEGAKLETARKAVGALLDELSENDTFQIVTFNVGADAWPAQPAPAAERERADAHLAQLRSAGGTDLLAALQTTADLMSADRPNVVVLLTDGISESADEAARRAPELFPAERTRVFGLGIGNEINRGVLATMARDTGGWTDFISTDGDVAHHAKLLARKIVHQSISDLQIRVEGVEAYDLHPNSLPHLFSGSQITVFGRYRGAGKATVKVSGTMMGKAVTLPVEVVFADDTEYPEIRRSWALKAVEDELEAKAFERVIALGVEHSIVTPYTSMLVLESEAQYGQFGIERRNPERVQQERQAQDQRQSKPRRPSGGGGGGLGGGGSIELVLLGLGLGAAVLSRRKRS